MSEESVVPEVSSEVVQEVVQEVLSDSVQEVVPDAVPEVVSDDVPDAVPEVVSDDVPDAVPEVVQEVGPSYLITLDELLMSQDVLKQKEADDKRIVDYIDNPNPLELRSKMHQWALQKFPDSFPVFSITVQPPQMCSDGVSRGLYDYIAFCSGQTIADKLQSLQSKMNGIQVLNSFSGNTITIHVSKL
jgi:hypothetical protein